MEKKENPQVNLSLGEARGEQWQGQNLTVSKVSSEARDIKRNTGDLINYERILCAIL